MSDTAASEAPAAGPLSIDQAVALMTAAPEAPRQDEPQADLDTVEIAAPEGDADTGDTQPEPDAQPAETPDAAETPSEEETAEATEPELPALEPPHFWAAEKKAAFNELPRHLQEIVVEQEKIRDAATSKAIQQAREAEKTAQAAKEAAEREASAIADMKARVDKLVPDEEAKFRERWGDNPDWVAIHNACLQQYGDQGLAQYQAIRANYDVESQQLQQLRAAKQELDAKADKAAAETKAREDEAYRAYVVGEAEKLKTLAPELADPKHGPERVRKVAEFLSGQGYSPEQLRLAGAADLAVAYDAMRYRQAQAAAKSAPAQPKPKPAPPASPTVKPTAAPVAIPQAQRSRREAEGRFYAKPTVDNAMAAILARSKG